MSPSALALNCARSMVKSTFGFRVCEGYVRFNMMGFSRVNNVLKATIRGVRVIQFSTVTVILVLRR
jgi:hypothetical protein